VADDSIRGRRFSKSDFQEVLTALLERTRRTSPPPSAVSRNLTRPCRVEAGGYKAESAAMTKLPPVPRDNRSPQGPGESPQVERASSDHKPPPRENLKEQGRQGNIAQNTTNQGYQQDR